MYPGMPLQPSRSPTARSSRCQASARIETSFPLRRGKTVWRDTQAGFTLVELLAVVLIIGFLTVLVRMNRPNDQANVDALVAQITSSATIGTLYTSILTGSGITDLRMTTNAPWLSDNLGTLSGTPDGNDFGTFDVTLTHGVGDNSESATATIEVADPTLTSPPTIVSPYHAVGSANVVIGPTPATVTSCCGVVGYRMSTGGSYNGTVTYVLTSNGPTGLSASPLSFTTDSSGGFQLDVSWESGADFTADIFLNLTSSMGRRITLGPIKARSE